MRLSQAGVNIRIHGISDPGAAAQEESRLICQLQLFVDNQAFAAHLSKSKKTISIVSLPGIRLSFDWDGSKT